MGDGGFSVPAGQPGIAGGVPENARGELNYFGEQTVRLAPAQIVVVEFHAPGGFRFLH